MTPTTLPPTPTAGSSTGLITADEFFRLYEHRHAELVQGRVVEDDMPSHRHGRVCARIAQLLSNFVDSGDHGHVMSNDTLLRLSANPDTIRGPDICYFSFGRLPKGEIPEGMLTAIPELVIEVRSPSNTWSKLFVKTGEYLEAGVVVVIVFDPDSSTASVYRPDELQQIFDNGDCLIVPDILPGFSVPVRQFFE